MKTTSPFYQTGKSNSPLFDTTHGKEGHAHPHTKKEYQKKRKGEIDIMQAKYNKLEEGPVKNKLGDKIDAHAIETTNKIRPLKGNKYFMRGYDMSKLKN